MNSNTDDKNLRILFLINHAGKGGSEKYVLNLAKAYNGKCAQCFFAYNEHGLLAEQMEALKIPSFRLEMRSPFDKVAAKQLAQICKENKIDVIHAQYPRENYIALLSKKYYKLPKVVYTCHLMVETPFWHKPINRFMTRKNHKVIAVCNVAADYLVRTGIRRDKIEVIFNGIVPHSEPPLSSTLREELGIAEDTFVITTLARYDAVKRLDYLTESVQKLKQTAKRPFKVLYVGDGDLYEDIQMQIKRLGLENDILQLGYRSDTDNILRGSDLFVNASENEALSFAILEALSHGLPIVATNVGGNGDIVNASTDCGTLVPFGNPDAMADAICSIMEDAPLYERLHENALRATKEIFDLNKILKDTFAVYQ